MSDKVISGELYTRMVEAIAFKLADVLDAMVNDSELWAYNELVILNKRDNAVALLKELGESPNYWVGYVATHPEELLPALDWTYEKFMEHVHGEGWEEDDE